MKLLPIAALLFSTGVYAELCGVDFIPPSERVDGTALDVSEIDYFEIWVDGVKWNMTIPGHLTHYAWWQFSPCDKCPKLQMKTVDKNGLKSDVSTVPCIPKSPGVCQ